MDRNELPLEPRHLGVPSSASNMISQPVVCLVPTKHLSCTDTNSLQTDQNEIPHDPRHLGVPFGASKMIYEPMVCSAQTMHLSCVKISNISKQIEMSFHLSLITLEYHRVRPKRFLILWHVWRKPCTYLDEDINTDDASAPTPVPIAGPLTRARARKINYQEPRRRPKGRRIRDGWIQTAERHQLVTITTVAYGVGFGRFRTCWKAYQVYFHMEPVPRPICSAASAIIQLPSRGLYVQGAASPYFSSMGCVSS